MIDLSNGSEWLKVFEQQKFAQAILDKPGKFKPIPLTIIPDFIESRFVVVSVLVLNSKLTWTYGGRALQIIQVSNESDIGFFSAQKTYPLRINDATLIEFDNLSTYYRVAVDVPRWFQAAYINLWVYVGSTLAGNIEEKLAEIKSQLDRIEQSMTTTTGQ